MQGIIWTKTPVGVITLDLGRRDIPFTRCEVRDWWEFGRAWDALPRSAQRELEAAGIGERFVSNKLLQEYFQVARALAA